MRKRIAWIFLVILLIITCLQFLRSSWKKLFLFEDRFTKEAFAESDQEVRDLLYYLNGQFSRRAGFEERINATEFIRSDLSARCVAFFSYLEEVDSQWTFPKFRSDAYEKLIDKKGKFFLKEYEKLHKEKEDVEYAPTKAQKKAIDTLFEESLRKTLDNEQEMIDAATIHRIYGKCFLNGKSSDSSLQKMFRKWTKKVLFYLDDIYPTITEETIVEDQEKLVSVPINLFENNEDIANIVDYIQKTSKGKGIVISATSLHYKDVVRLIITLRALNNRYPIQIVHRGDLNMNSRKNIVLAATLDYADILSTKKKKKQVDVAIKSLLLENAKKFGSKFEKQTIHFVNVKKVLEKNHRYLISGYYNKLMAVLFSSFEEVMLLDSDVVPLVSMDTFFKSEQYSKNHALFFKDRTLLDSNDFIETNFFAKLFPREDTVDSLFDIDSVTNFTLKNNYLSGYRHFQEAGVIVIDKVKHLSGVLMLLSLSIWEEPVRGAIWGDKELYWLGLSVAGDEKYEFNLFSAASIGQYSDPTLSHYPQSSGKELCSSHPGHIDDKGRLMWINSGFKYCKKNNFYGDNTEFPLSELGKDVLSSLYEEPLQIKNAVIPPDPLPLRDLIECRFDTEKCAYEGRTSYIKFDVDEYSAKENVNQVFNSNPHKGWIKSSICSGYQYCAYEFFDEITKDTKENGMTYKQGKIFDFSDVTPKYEYLGNVWINGQVS